MPALERAAEFAGRERMEFPRRRFLHMAAGAAALTVASQAALAQTYPAKPITMIVPFAAGGSTDVIGRILAERMRVSLGQTIIIENATGAGGTIGVGRAVRAAPDGYTISLGQNGSHVITGATYGNLSYNLLTDFEPVSLLVISPFVITATKATPANDLKGLIAYLKANPGRTVGNAGMGSITHVAGLVFQSVTGTQLQFVPYRGTGPAMQDLVAGQIDMMIGDPITGMPHVRAGLLKIYGVASDTRLPSAPEVPTVDEAGLPSFHISLWHGLWVPKGTPKPIIAKLHEAVLDALADPATRAKLAHAGQEIFPRDQQTPEALASLQKADIEKWWPIIKASGFKVE
jgi:tripartite-type tricarboxylate transporter receptor subunit TctC